MNENVTFDKERELEPNLGAAEVLRDRRRPGRTSVDNPWLVRLFRRQFLPPNLAAPEIGGISEGISEADHDRSDALAPARGILLGIILAAFLWGGIALGGWSLYRLIRLL